jgi:hypothetical protein
MYSMRAADTPRPVPMVRPGGDVQPERHTKLPIARENVAHLRCDLGEAGRDRGGPVVVSRGRLSEGGVVTRLPSPHASRARASNHAHPRGRSEATRW